MAKLWREKMHFQANSACVGLLLAIFWPMLPSNIANLGVTSLLPVIAKFGRVWRISLSRAGEPVLTKGLRNH